MTIATFTATHLSWIFENVRVSRVYRIIPQFDGKNLYMSQWYKERILMFDDKGNMLREIGVGAEICGHTFVNGSLYVLRGHEKPNEDWRIARLNPQEETPVRRRYRGCAVCVPLADFRRRTVLVQLSRERHDNFIHSSDLKDFSIVRDKCEFRGFRNPGLATVPVFWWSDRLNLRRIGFSTSRPAVLPMWK